MYGGAPFVEEWKPLPPRLHADVSEQHTVEIGRVAVGVPRVHRRRRRPARPALVLDDARAYAASLGARLPRSSSGSSPPTEPSFRVAEPLVWN